MTLKKAGKTISSSRHQRNRTPIAIDEQSLSLRSHRISDSKGESTNLSPGKMMNTMEGDDGGTKRSMDVSFKIYDDDIIKASDTKSS